MANYRLKDQVLVRDLASFKWKAAWLRGVEVTTKDVLVSNAFLQGVPLPDGWRPALRALQALKDARRVSKKDPPPNVPYLDCDLIGVPKPVFAPTGPRCSGTCITFSERGRPANYALVAHVHSDVWICSPGASIGHSIMGTPVWDNASCIEKDLSRDLWSTAAVSKRRVRGHMHAGNLRPLLVDHADAFAALVADKTWEAEVRRASIEERNVNFEAAGAMYENNPFRWESDDRVSHSMVEYCWRWEQAGAMHFERKTVRLDDAVRGQVPLPERLFTDASLYKRLLDRAKVETEQTYCPCKYLGLRTDSGYEPNPANWPVGGRKSHEKIWLQFMHVRNSVTNKPHIVCIHANSFLSRTTRVAGNPLNVTAARSLRFSIEFLNAFAENRLPGMKFRGVSYENAERPEIICHLANDIDIQNEIFWWDLPSGECICRSLLQLMDDKLDTIIPEGNIDAYQIVGSELGYDTLGIPGTEQDDHPRLMYNELT